MKLISRSLLRKLVLLLAPIAAIFLPSHGLAQQKQQDETRSVMTWEHSDNGFRQRLEIRGKAEFNDDYTDVKDVSEDGVVRIEEVRNGQSRRYEVRRDAGGQLTRAFYVNGEKRQLDAAAQTWIAQLVLNAVRQGGIDADKRVQSILNRNGVAGVLHEIDQIESDYAKRRYFEALVKHGNLNETALRDTLAQAARQIKSDYEQAQLLIGVAPVLATKQGAMPAFFQAVDTIQSDYEHRRVLSAVVKTKNLSEETLTQLLDSAAALSSDYEKATLLLDVSNAYTGDASLRSAFLKVVETIKSDYERGRVLSALLKNKQIG